MRSLHAPATTAVFALVLLSACRGAAAHNAPPDTIAEIRQATARYRDVHAALADGYIRDPMNMCITASTEGQPAWLGGMGVHYFRADLLGITGTTPRVNGKGTHTDFMHPAVLIYEPQADGSLQLVAVENLVFEKAWHAAGHSSPPSFEGHEYFHMVDNPSTPADEAHGFEPHYELHIWTERTNPSGTFMQFNPAIACKYHKQQPASSGRSGR
ncbi:MAG TPA: hypothetical protein VF166_14570 [Gemmatimonadaceae bacterium]